MNIMYIAKSMISCNLGLVKNKLKNIRRHQQTTLSRKMTCDKFKKKFCDN